MTIADQLQQMRLVKHQLREEITAKGVDVPVETPFLIYPEKVRSIIGLNDAGIAPPEFNPPPGAYVGFVKVDVTAEQGKVYAISNSNLMDLEELVFSLDIDATRTISVFAFDKKTGKFSDIISATYTIKGHEITETLASGRLVNEEVTIINRKEDYIIAITEVLEIGKTVGEELTFEEAES